jgi:hypothetical protein
MQMPLPTVSDLYLVRLVWGNASAPRAASNDLYFKDQAGGHTGTDVYNAIDAHWARNMIYVCSANSSIDKIVTTKLDGSAASVDHITGSGVKWTGLGNAELILQGAAVVTIKTGFRGRSRRGRIYLPWITEDFQSEGVLQTAGVAAMQTAWGTFLSDMVTAGYPLHVCSKLHNDSVQAASITCRPYLKTQRRRSRR